MSIRFRQVKLSDGGKIRAAVGGSGELGCEYCFGNIFMWAPFYGTEIALDGNFLVSREDVPSTRYLCPTGSGDDAEFSRLITLLIEDARAAGREFIMHRVGAAGRERIERLFPDRFTFTPERDDFDYIYSREALATLAGKKYHSKRNFVTRFENENPDFSYESVTRDNIADCIRICEIWHEAQEQKNPLSVIELAALRTGFNNYVALGYTGGLLRVAGKPAAFTVGEAINAGCFVTHAEKAIGDYTGIYAQINKLFAQNALSAFSLVNREEDMGMEGLRTAKLSYNPQILYEKYIVKER